MTELADTEITQPLAPEITGTPAQIAELYAALAAVQAELPAVKKNHLADMGTYSYYYADLDDVSDAIMPVLGKHGLAFTCLPGHQPDGRFGLPYKLVHRSGASLEGFWTIPEQGGMQVIGGRITYARRYCLCAVTGITAGEDTDAREDAQVRSPQPAAQRNPRRTPGPSPAPPRATPAAASTPVPVNPAESAGEALNPAPAVPVSPAPAAGAVPTRNRDTPGTATRGKGGQLSAIWTILSDVFGFGDDEKPQARAVCEHIARRRFPGESTGSLSWNEAIKVLDTLKIWEEAAKRKGEHPRDYLIAVMVAQDAADGEARDGE